MHLFEARRAWFLTAIVALADCMGGRIAPPSPSSEAPPRPAETPVAIGAPSAAISGGAQLTAASGQESAVRTAPPRDDGPSAAPCKEFDAPVSLGKVDSDDLSEISGVVASRAQPGVLYVHNDSGDTARFFALSREGHVLGVFSLRGAKAVDWEDIAMGPGSPRGVLYLGDIGDNAAREGRAGRSSIVVYRVQEPVVAPRQGNLETVLDGWQALTLTYPDEAHDAEALFIDPWTGDLYLITKEMLRPAVVFRLAAPLPFGKSARLEKVTTLDLPGWGPARMATAADISPSGRSILVRNYQHAALYLREGRESVAEALKREAVVVPTAPERQGEAIAFAHDEGGYFTLSEGPHPSVNFAHARCAPPRTR